VKSSCSVFKKLLLIETILGVHMMIRSNEPSSNQKFQLGDLVITPGANEALEKAQQSAFEILARHISGDWGDLDQHDKQQNELAIAYEGDVEKQNRVFSAYMTKLGEKIWVITEADRSSTCILLPEEY
jgi:hypothetical protein